MWAAGKEYLSGKKKVKTYLFFLRKKRKILETASSGGFRGGAAPSFNVLRSI
jgi:hypothetical protein